MHRISLRNSRRSRPAPEAEVESLTSIVRYYYECPDARDTYWVSPILAPGAVCECFNSTDSAHETCHVLRQIRGTHVLRHVWQAEPKVVMALGEFDAIGAIGDRYSMRFIDVWHFDVDGRIEQRQTFLSKGHRGVQA